VLFFLPIPRYVLTTLVDLYSSTVPNTQLFKLSFHAGSNIWLYRSGNVFNLFIPLQEWWLLFTKQKISTVPNFLPLQACGFRDNYDLIRNQGFGVYGLSFDTPEDQTNWKNKESLQYELLTDTSGDALKALGAFKEPQNVIRSHFVIEKGGKILLLENGVKSGDSFGQVVEFINNLKK
jgi:hypothetical protein